jgi:hypothetical protein
MSEAKVTVDEALQRYPNLTIESIANDPGTSEAERQRHIETMRLAGFPACAQPEDIAKFAKPIRLPECTEKPWAANAKRVSGQGKGLPKRASLVPCAQYWCESAQPWIDPAAVIPELAAHDRFRRCLEQAVKGPVDLGDLTGIAVLDR